MSFKEYLNVTDEQDRVENETIIESSKELPKRVQLKEAEKADEILRRNNFKIKSTFSTKFGTEYLMAKKYDEEDIKKVLKDFNIKFDDKSIFVVN